jgi:hypothetical protein
MSNPTADELKELVKNIDSVKSDRNTKSKIALTLNITVIIFLLILSIMMFMNNSTGCASKISLSLGLFIYTILLILQIFCQNRINNQFVVNNYYLVFLSDWTKTLNTTNIVCSTTGLVIVIIMLVLKFMGRNKGGDPSIDL